MAAIVLKNVPDELQRRLKAEAGRNRRSMAQEAVMILERSLQTIAPIKLPTPVEPLKRITSAMVLRATRAGRR